MVIATELLNCVEGHSVLRIGDTYSSSTCSRTVIRIRSKLTYRQIAGIISLMSNSDTRQKYRIYYSMIEVTRYPFSMNETDRDRHLWVSYADAYVTA
jgi:hypothetical protein